MIHESVLSKRFLGKAKLLICLFLLITRVAAQNRELWDSLSKENVKAHSLIYVDLDSAEKISTKLLEVETKPIDSLVLSDFYSVNASIAFEKGNMEKALSMNFRSLQLREAKKASSKIATSLLNLANVYYYTNAYKKSIQYLKRAIQINKSAEVPESKFCSVYNTLALNYNKLDQRDSAEYYFEKAINILEKANNEGHVLADLYGNLGALYFDSNLTVKAERAYKKALGIYEGLSIANGAVWTYMRLSQLYLRERELESAIRCLRNAQRLSVNSANQSAVKEMNYFLANYFMLSGQPDSAEHYLKQYTLLQDSLSTLRTKKNIQEMEAKYQVEKKEAALALSKENEARLAAENRSQKVVLSMSIGGLIILSLVFFFAIRSYNQKKKINEMELEIKDSKLDELLSNQESKSFASILKGQEEERERIAQELHDRLGGTLAALKLALRRPGNKVSAEDMEIVNEAVKEVRSISHNLSSGIVQQYGFDRALKQLFRRIEGSGEVKYNLYLHPSTSRLGHSVGIELYRIVQELLSNTIKHAEATEVSVQTNFDEKTFNLIYEDNGKGFEVEKIKSGIGIEHIKKRVKRLKGSLNLDSSPGRGTIVIIELNQKT